ncbi:hypothetical protein AMIS_44560 [Actinoplanes missouriensis 431]|uniref:Uncharacterized protein n=1 Tax=Actinoplanes missouriensis (strain ATCC 14538 / DSM 43046 / CBS 188.64 / JCM 3121 / NBRC 102363 / NCIMB 12654 / NRRL B-3342 / UNCC 431) TaxID=512565 RepID=I0H9I9_ACTM4|nr:hypothetical protein AMIS_44560 [Actinoplanes missouriensis 431]
MTRGRTVKAEEGGLRLTRSHSHGRSALSAAGHRAPDRFHRTDTIMVDLGANDDIGTHAAMPPDGKASGTE